MAYGMSVALNEITLVFFTTLSPSAVVACVILAVMLLAFPLTDEQRLKLNRGIGIPLGLSMLGLIASATHLGSPENALYVFLGVGRSPLSNEVFSAVLFLSACGLFWLLCFMQKQRIGLQRFLCALIIITGLSCVVMIGLAYNAPTIIGWNTVYVPLSLIVSAFVGGPILTILTLTITFQTLPDKRLIRLLLMVSACMLVINIIILGIQNSSLDSVWNSFTTATELVPLYSIMIVLYAGLSFLALLMLTYMFYVRQSLSWPVILIAPSLFLVGLFVVRFGFYMMHMTVGVGL